MSRRFFTSDLHLGSTNILRYAGRPYHSAEEALTVLTANVNTTAGENDVLIHCGDFMLNGCDRHGKVEDRGLKYGLDDYLAMLKPNVFLLSGNHDDGHNSEAFANNMWVDLNQNWRNVYVSHYPSYHKLYRGPESRAQFRKHVALCGHVHEKWLLCLDEERNVLNVNVGVDAWNMYPVEDAELTSLLDFVRDAKVPMLKREMTGKDLLEWHKANEAALKAGRDERRKKRYERKGLTEEECRRRKEEALAAKRAARQGERKRAPGAESEAKAGNAE